jgi:DNA-binding PadR family transcriptional regulator
VDFVDCPCTGRTLVRLVRPAVLAFLAREPLHGYELLKRLPPLALFHGQAPDATGVYRLLREMEGEGLVASDWEPAGRGPAKRRYAVTPDGRACLARWIATLTDYQAAIAQLLGAAQLALGPQQTPPAKRPALE